MLNLTIKNLLSKKPESNIIFCNAQDREKRNSSIRYLINALFLNFAFVSRIAQNKSPIWFVGDYEKFEDTLALSNSIFNALSLDSDPSFTRVTGVGGKLLGYKDSKSGKELQFYPFNTPIETFFGRSCSACFISEVNEGLDNGFTYDLFMELVRRTLGHNRKQSMMFVTFDKLKPNDPLHWFYNNFRKKQYAKKPTDGVLVIDDSDIIQATEWKLDPNKYYDSVCRNMLRQQDFQKLCES